MRKIVHYKNEEKMAKVWLPTRNELLVTNSCLVARSLEWPTRERIQMESDDSKQDLKEGQGNEPLLEYSRTGRV